MKKKFFQRFLFLAAMAALLLSGCGASEEISDSTKYEHQSGLRTNTQLKSIRFYPSIQLFPVFDGNTNEAREKRVYTASVLNNIDEVTIEPELYDRFSTMTVNGIRAESEPIALISGENNFIEVEITSESGVADSYKFTIYRSSDSMDVDLASLEVSEGELEPSFGDNPNGSWTVSVPYETEEIKVTPTAADTNVTSITVNDESPDKGVKLKAGETTLIFIKVTAQEVSETKQYVLKAKRGAYTASDIVTLKSLTISAGTIVQEVTLNNDPWTASVGYDDTPLTITPEKGHPGQTITVDGEDPSKPVSLGEGETTIEIKVTAEDGQNYALYDLIISRALNYDSSLSNLAINFDDGSTTSLNLDNNANSWIVVDASEGFTITPSATDNENAVIKIDTAVVTSGTPSSRYYNDVGTQKDIVIEVTAADNNNYTEYVLTVKRPAANASDNNQLADLYIEPGGLDTTFSSTTYYYDATVPSDTVSVEVVATPGHAEQNITINGAKSPATITLLSQGSTEITVKTVAGNGVSKETIITVKRQLTHDANLASIVVSEGTLLDSEGNGFNEDTLSYYVSVSAISSDIDITPTAKNANITGIEVSANPVASGSQISIPLSTGLNEVPIVVTADDTTTIKTYNLYITRPENTALKSLSVSTGAENLVPNKDVNGNWALDVGAEVSEVTITAVPDEATASVKLQTVDGTDITGFLNIPEGETLVNIIITSDSGTDSETHKLTINKAAGGAAPLLSDISITMGQTTPTNRPLYADFNSAPLNTDDRLVFSPDTKEYAAVVYGFNTISVKATVTDESKSSIKSITINNSGTFDSTNGFTEVPEVLLYNEPGYVTPVRIVVTGQDEKTTTYTVNVKLLNIDEFYRIVYRPPMDKAYPKPRWESIKPEGTLQNKTIPGIVDGLLRWQVVFGGRGILNHMGLEHYYDGQYEVPYNDNGVIVNGRTVGDLRNEAFGKGYHGYVEGYPGYVVKIERENLKVEGYKVYLPNNVGGDWVEGDEVAHLRYQLKVLKKEKLVAPDSWVKVTYMNESKQFHYRLAGDPDCPVINPVDEAGFTWSESWDEHIQAPCFNNNFAAKDPEYTK